MYARGGASRYIIKEHSFVDSTWHRIRWLDLLGVRSDKNRRNFEVFARFFGRIGHIWTLLPLEREIFFGVRATLKDSLCTWEGYESSGTPFIFDRSARKWISVVGPDDLNISARYLNALLAACHRHNSIIFPCRIPVQFQNPL